MKIKIYIIIIILGIQSSIFAEDWMGYVLRYNYQGRDFYWVYDSAQDESEQLIEINPTTDSIEFIEVEK